MRRRKARNLERITRWSLATGQHDERKEQEKRVISPKRPAGGLVPEGGLHNGNGHYPAYD